MKLYEAIAGCVRRGYFHPFLAEYLPSGSGFDSQVRINLDKCTDNKLVFEFSYHHMNEDGFYTHWTHHRAVVTPDLIGGINIKISGRQRDVGPGWFDMCYDIFHHALCFEKECF